MKDLTPTFKNVEMAYDKAMTKMAKIAKKELLRAGEGMGIITFESHTIQVFEGDVYIDNVVWENIPNRDKLIMYNYLATKRILK